MTNISQSPLFGYKVGDNITLNDGSKGVIVEVLRVEQEDHWYQDDTPLPIGELIYKVRLDFASYTYATRHTLITSKLLNSDKWFCPSDTCRHHIAQAKTGWINVSNYLEWEKEGKQLFSPSTYADGFELFYLATHQPVYPLKYSAGTWLVLRRLARFNVPLCPSCREPLRKRER